MLARSAYWVAGLIVFLSGLLVGTVRIFDISERLSAGNVLQALTSLLVALVIGVAVQRSLHEAKVENELLISHAKEVVSSMRAARDKFTAAYHGQVTSSTDLELTSALKLVSVQINALQIAGENCKRAVKSDNLARARTAYRNYWRLVTEHAFSSEVKIAAETFGRAESEFGNFTEAMLLYSIEINRRH